MIDVRVTLQKSIPRRFNSAYAPRTLGDFTVASYLKPEEEDDSVGQNIGMGGVLFRSSADDVQKRDRCDQVKSSRILLTSQKQKLDRNLRVSHRDGRVDW